jgi:hypothetical protein
MRFWRNARTRGSHATEGERATARPSTLEAERTSNGSHVAQLLDVRASSNGSHTLPNLLDDLLVRANGSNGSNGSNGRCLLEKLRVSVVIPTLNEASNLPYVLPRIPPTVFEVIIVDGKSTDGTAEVARKLRPEIRVIHQDGHGKGNALRCGFEAATGDVIVMLDADGSSRPEEIQRFVEALAEGADFAKGSRFLDGGGSADITRLRRIGNRSLVGLVNLLYRTKYSDLCYGYNAFWARCLPTIGVDCNGFEVETLINIRAARAGLNVIEVASNEDRRMYGASNLNAVRDGLRVLHTILHERFARSAAAGDLDQESVVAAERPSSASNVVPLETAGTPPRPPQSLCHPARASSRP